MGHRFNYYHGADPSEYDLVLSNSEGGLDRLRELGARRAEAVFWGSRPRGLPTGGRREGVRRLLLTATATSFRREWMQAMVESRVAAIPTSTSSSEDAISAETSAARA